MTKGQRAMVAAKLATMRSGTRTDLQPSVNLREVSNTEASQLLNIGERSVERAKTSLKNSEVGEELAAACGLVQHYLPLLSKAIKSGLIVGTT